MALSELQIERVREIIGFVSYSEAAALLSNLTAVQETETAADITEWNLVRNKFTRIVGGGVEIDKADNRLAIINRLRRRLGLLSVKGEMLFDNSNSGAYCYSHPESTGGCGE